MTHSGVFFSYVSYKSCYFFTRRLETSFPVITLTCRRGLSTRASFATCRAGPLCLWYGRDHRVSSRPFGQWWGPQTQLQLLLEPSEGTTPSFLAATWFTGQTRSSPQKGRWQCGSLTQKKSSGSKLQRNGSTRQTKTHQRIPSFQAYCRLSRSKRQIKSCLKIVLQILKGLPFIYVMRHHTS